MITVGIMVFLAGFGPAFLLTYAALVNHLPADMPAEIRAGIEWIVTSSGALNVGLPIDAMWKALGIYVQLWGIVLTVRVFIWLYHQVPVFGGSD